MKAYIRIGEGRESAEAYDIYVKALELSVSDDERAMAVDCLGRLGDEKILPVIRPYLDGESDRLKEAAATALAPVALKMNDTDLLKRVVMQSDDVGRVQEAASKLREAGVEVDVPVRKGYVKHFWVLGPLGGREEVRDANLVDAGAPVDLSASVQYNDETYQWNYHPLDQIQGKLDLLDVVARRGDVGAYVYAEVMCEEALDVLFKIGSDDDVFCWLNGKRVHAFEGGRGWRADQDSAEAQLRQGANAILVMVLNGGGDWAVSLRVTDRMGNPLELEQKKP